MKKYLYSSFLIVIILVSSLIIFQLWKLNNINDKNGINIANIKKGNFKSELLEDTIEKFKLETKKSNIEISKFSLIKYDNKTYYKMSINNLKNSEYLIHYEGINVSALYASIFNVNEANMPTVENIITTLICVSDKNIDKIESKKICSELLLTVDKNKNSSQLKYKNNLIYTLEITDNSNIIFSIK